MQRLRVVARAVWKHLQALDLVCELWEGHGWKARQVLRVRLHHHQIDPRPFSIFLLSFVLDNFIYIYIYCQLLHSLRLLHTKSHWTVFWRWVLHGCADCQLKADEKTIYLLAFIENCTGSDARNYHFCYSISFLLVITIFSCLGVKVFLGFVEASLICSFLFSFRNIMCGLVRAATRTTSLADLFQVCRTFQGRRVKISGLYRKKACRGGRLLIHCG